MSDRTYTGRCFCGAVEVSVKGEPAGVGYCHCASCREWSAAPVNGFTLWKTADVQVTKGASNIGSFNKTDHSRRQWCKTCGGHLMTAHPSWDLVDVYAATIPEFPFTPQLHVHYAESVMPMMDGKPKFKDIPSELGGSGEQLQE
jgi:hypothetical protein